MTNVAVRRSTGLRRGRVGCRAGSRDVACAVVVTVAVMVMIVAVAAVVRRNSSHVTVVVLIVAVVVVAVLSIHAVHAVAVVAFPRKISGFRYDGGDGADRGVGRSAQNRACFRRFAVAGSAKARCQTRAHHPVLLLLMLR